MKTLRIFALVGAAIAFCSAFATDIGPPAVNRHEITTIPVQLKIEVPGRSAVAEAPIALVATSPKVFAIPSSRKALQSEPPASNWSGAWVYRLSGDKEDRASAGVLTKITPLTGVGGKFTLSLDGYAGVSLRKSIPVAAAMAGGELKLADQLRLGLHAGAIIAQNQPTGACVGASLSLKFAGL